MAKGVDGQCQKAQDADAPLQREQRRKVEPLAVLVHLAEDECRGNEAYSLDVHEAVEITLGQQMVIGAEGDCGSEERRQLRQLSGERRHLHVDRMHAVPEAVDGPHDKECDGCDDDDAEEHSACFACGPVALCFPSACYHSGSEHEENGQEQNCGVLGDEGEANREAA